MTGVIFFLHGVTYCDIITLERRCDFLKRLVLILNGFLFGIGFFLALLVGQIFINGLGW